MKKLIYTLSFSAPASNAGKILEKLLATPDECEGVLVKISIEKDTSDDSGISVRVTSDGATRVTANGDNRVRA